MPEENNKYEKLTSGTKIYRSWVGGAVTVMAVGTVGNNFTSDGKNLTTKEFEAYRSAHQQWAEEVMKSNEHRFSESKDAWLRIEGKLDRFLQRGGAAAVGE